MSVTIASGNGSTAKRTRATKRAARIVLGTRSKGPAIARGRQCIRSRAHSDVRLPARLVLDMMSIC